MTQRYDQPSEYGGRDGSNYIRPDRTPRSLSVGERARLLRTAGLNPDSGNPAMDPDPGSIQLVPGFRQG